LCNRIFVSLLLIAGFTLIGMTDQAASQDIEVSGTVVDSDGEALPGVTIMIMGTGSGTVSNLEGEFSLSAPADGTLIFSFIGYNRLEVPIEGRNNIDVVMEESISELGELLVTGYTAQRQADITGAVSTVDIEGMTRVTSASFLEGLQGRVSGVTINTSGSPGSRNTVRIRGVSSFQNNDPLYIVDGVPIQDAYNNWLNPNDIETMQVLKDASAASIYGARANNGVIIITTKQGRPGAPQISLDASFGVASPVKGYDSFLIQDPFEYHEVMRRAHVNAGLDVPTNIYGDPNNPSIPNYIWPNDGVNQTMNVDESTYSFPDNLIMPANPNGTNWWQEVFDPALVQDYNLRFSGGSDNALYNVSFNYYDQDGTMKYNWYRRGQIRVNTQFTAGRFTIGENISLTVDESTGGMTSGNMGEDTGVGQMIKMQPIIPVYDVNGYFAGAKANTLGNGSNPVAQLYKNKDDIGSSRRLVGSVFGSVDLMDVLEVRSTLGFDLGESTFKGFTFPTPENSEPNTIYGLGENYNRFTNWNWTNTINYVQTFADRHNVSALAGMEAVRNSNVGMNGNMAGYITTSQDAWYIQDALGDPGTKNVSSFGGFSNLLSFFGKIDYNFASKYYLSATLRHDGSSRLGPGNKWGTFPAFSVGWRLSEEAFLQNATFVSDLRIRAGYGVTGNQQITAGRVFNQFGGSTSTSFYDISGSGSGLEPGFRLTSIGNPDLKWEQNESYNIGLDAEFLEGRITFVLDVYQREVDDLLFDPSIPAAQGNAAPPIVNIGKMRNTGFDVAVGYRGTIGNEVSWNIDLNGSHYKNEIVRIDGEQEFFFGPIGGRGGSAVINQIGHPIGAFYGYVADGIFQNQSEVDAHADQDGAAPGRIRFKDVNGDGQITASDRTVIGSYHPDFTAGLNLGAQWRNFDFNAFIFGSFGNDIFDITKEFTVFRLFSTNVRRDRLTDSWTPDNPNAKYPQLDQNDNFSDAYSSFYVEDASYVRLQNLQVGYNVPQNVLPGFRSLRVYVQAQNLLTITGYNNIDPAISAHTNSGAAGERSDQSNGIDRGSYPNNRILTFGFSAGF
jgi:TonB-dependent starch-binding outer membrane protein SusC